MRERNDKPSMRRLRAEYLAYTASEIDYYGELHKKIFGRETPQVLLLHVSRLNADVLDRILATFEAKRYRYITLGQAQADPAYRTPEAVTRFGPMWGYRWAEARGVKVNGKLEPEPPQWVLDYGRPTKN